MPAPLSDIEKLFGWAETQAMTKKISVVLGRSGTQAIIGLTTTSVAPQVAVMSQESPWQSYTPETTPDELVPAIHWLTTTVNGIQLFKPTPTLLLRDDAVLVVAMDNRPKTRGVNHGITEKWQNRSRVATIMGITMTEAQALVGELRVKRSAVHSAITARELMSRNNGNILAIRQHLLVLRQLSSSELESHLAGISMFAWILRRQAEFWFELLHDIAACLPQQIQEHR